MLVDVLEPALLHMPEMADDAFFDFCESNEVCRIERTADGPVLVLPLAGPSTGLRYVALLAQVSNWSHLDGTGAGFGSRVLFRLPNSAMRSPDAAWVSLDRLRSLTAEEGDTFLPLCPDFVVELTSPSDRIRDVRAKMSEWIAHGAKLGWLLEVDKRRVHVYRSTGDVEIFEGLTKIQGEGQLATFTLNLAKIWDPGW